MDMKATGAKTLLSVNLQYDLLSLFQVLLVEQNVDMSAKMVCWFVFRCIDSLFVIQCY